MAIIKSYTDLEQSKKLAEILGFENADMYYKYVLPKSDRIIYTPEIGNPVESLKWYNEGYTFRGKREPITLSEYCIPCWSLTTLLEILDYPQLSKDKLGSEKVGWMVSVYPDNCRYDSSWYDNPVDACVAMIIKLHELKML
jgi:hypothetical protein